MTALDKNNLNKNKKAQIILGFFVFISSCGKLEQHQNIKGETMGTSYSIKFENKNNNIDSIRFSVDSILFNLNMQMSTWIDSSEISRFNNLKKGEKIEVSKEFLFVLNKGIEIFNQTNGAFDFTVFPLLNIWGFGPNKRSTFKKPVDENVIKTLESVGAEKIIIENNYIIKSHLNQKLDLNAIAKGYAVDAVFDWFKKNKYNHIFVEIGGEIRTFGLNSTNSPWLIGVETPQINSDDPLFKTINLSGKSIATSGNYRNFNIHNNGLYPHTIDPRLGRPVVTNILSVSVIAEECIISDAWATGLMVMSLDEGIQAVSNSVEIDAMWIYLNEKDELTFHKTDGFPD